MIVRLMQAIFSHSTKHFALDAKYAHVGKHQKSCRSTLSQSGAAMYAVLATQVPTNMYDRCTTQKSNVS